MIRVAEVGLKNLKSIGWDNFAEGCDASFWCAQSAIASIRFDGQVLLGMRYYEIHCDQLGAKIGQCAIVTGRRQAVFVDRLQVPSEYEHLWEPAMAALLAKLGPGRYRYGSQWNIERPRDRNFRNLNGVTVKAIENITIQAVDFARWQNWEDYFRQISNNARRNAKRAAVRYPDLCVRVRRGLSVVLDVVVMTKLHFVTASRKTIRLSLVWVLMRFLLRTVAMRKYTMTAVAVFGGGALAAFSGIEFGRNTFYLNGGSEAENGGAAWHLILIVIRAAYHRTRGAGKFLMGSVQEGGVGWDNLARSRAQCRVSDFPTSIVTFAYLAADAAGG